MVTPLERLARYDGHEFQPVAPGSVSAPFVHVLTHGWYPGSRLTERLLATADGVAALPVWDPRLSTPDGKPLITTYLELISALADLGEDHTVLWYSWLDESATDIDIFQAFRSRQATPINGRRLSIAIQQALTPGHQPQLQFIGHSHGCAVVTHTAACLPQPPRQLTLLDAPEDPFSRIGGAADLIEVVLPRLRPGRDRGQMFVDSYASTFGRPYHGHAALTDVVDVQLTPAPAWTLDPVQAIVSAHVYPVGWYAKSVRNQNHGVGYGWSPLAGADISHVHPWYRSTLPYRPLDLHRRFGIPAEQILSRALRSKRARRIRQLEVPDLIASGTQPQAQVITVESGDQLVEFDIDIATDAQAAGSQADQDMVTLSLDSSPACILSPRYPVPASGRYLMLADAKPGEHLLTLQAGGSSIRQVRLGNIRAVRENPLAASFSFERTATTLFRLGVATGAMATLGSLLALRALWRRFRHAG